MARPRDPRRPILTVTLADESGQRRPKSSLLRTIMLCGLALDGPLDAALTKYIEDTRPRPKTQAVIVTALEDFLREKGYLPSITITHTEDDDDGSGT